MLHIVSPFQNGKVLVKDGEVVALYNPLETLLNKYPEAIVIPVDSYAKEACKFGAWVPAKTDDFEDADEDGKTAILGFEAAKSSVAVRVANANGMFCLIAVGKDQSITAAAIADDCFTNRRADFLVQNVICFKSLMVADYKAVLK